MQKTILSLVLAFAAGQASANEFAEPLAELAAPELVTWVADPAIIAAVRAQNEAHAGLTQADIDALDLQWRAEAGAPAALITPILGNSLSEYLRGRKEAGAGLYGEIFVMDNHGLNVGQSDVTSDYWQGDEDKWQVPQSTGGVHFGDVEFDESAQTYLSQVSLPIVDPDSGAFIGAITVGVNVEALVQ
jgi:hypothetical protein